MSRNQLIQALCDIYGYSPLDFVSQCFTDIWWYLDPTQQSAIKEYVGVDNALRVAGIN